MSRPPLGSTINILGMELNWYSLLIVVAVIVGILLAMREERRMHLPKDTVVNFALLAIPLGLIGARLYYVIFSWGRFADNIMEVFRIWHGGLAIYGGILGAILAAFLVTRGKGSTDFWTLLDVCAPSLALGQAIGRWGNYANMEAYGARIYDEAAQFFPIAVEIRLVGANGAEYWYWHMATFFYESMWCLVIFCLLWFSRKRPHARGDIIRWYVLLYCAGRTVIEGLRDDSLMLNVSAAQVRISQVLSAIACVAVVAVFFARVSRARKLHLADYLCWALVALGIACAFVGEFERNAYQMLFIPAQILLALLLAVDVVFLLHYVGLTRRLNLPSVLTLICAGMCVLTLLLGIGRLGASNTAYVALRQSVSMLHVLLSGLWFYLRGGKPRRKTASQERIDSEEGTNHATA
ncbi:prolipoprotein diacylglyceryl transferase [Eubacteriales bacterium OttesenSCG-928-A19]|nr:prolipoprotein diacylglyceryl transferase [Eubacteriales bacterium OttesenSCG-928-A19]